MIDIPVRRVMSSPVRTSTPGASARDVAERLRGHDIGGLVVVEGDGPVSPVGIVSESDVVDLVAAGQDPETVTVGEFMASPVVTVTPDEEVRAAAECMRSASVRRLPVVDGDGDLAGIVTATDLTHYIPRIAKQIPGRRA